MAADQTLGLTPPRVVGVHFARAGHAPRALDWLERADDGRDPALVMLKASPDFASLRGHPRYQALLRRVGFPD